MASIAADAIVVERPNAVRRGGWLLAAGMLASIVVMIISMVYGSVVSDYADDLALTLGKSSDDLTTSEVAQVANHFPGHWLVYCSIYLVPLGVFTIAVHELRKSLRSPRTDALLAWAWRSAIAMMTVWVGIHLLLLGLVAGPDNLPPLVVHFNSLSEPADLLTGAFGLAAVICLAFACRRSALAPRLSLVVIALAGFGLIVGVGTYIVTTGDSSMEADIALIPALVLGIGLVLATRKSRQPAWQPEASSATA